MLKMMRHILRITEIYDQCSAGPTPTTRRVRDRGVYPYRGQTKQGLMLEMNGRFPYALHTPLGLYNLAPANLRTLDVGRFRQQVTMENMLWPSGSHAPVRYDVTAVQGVLLPEPLERDHDHYIPPFEAELSWWPIHKLAVAEAAAEKAQKAGAANH
jgi:hypothetical protein